jgi:hypothetical protein
MAPLTEGESEEESFGELWKAVFETYYDAFYNEVLADKLVNRWQIADDASNILVAVTASGSALSGWALWNQPGYRLLWTGLAGFSAILGITHSSLGVAHRLKDWGEIKRSFAMLRIELETLQYRMKFDFKATNRDFQRQFIKHRRQYLRAVQRLKNDVLLRKGLELAAQKDIDRRIAEDQKGE